MGELCVYVVVGFPVELVGLRRRGGQRLLGPRLRRRKHFMLGDEMFALLLAGADKRIGIGPGLGEQLLALVEQLVSPPARLRAACLVARAAD